MKSFGLESESKLISVSEPGNVNEPYVVSVLKYHKIWLAYQKFYCETKNWFKL